MGFKENLLKKIEIEKMANTVQKSFGDYDSGVRMDKATMKKLLQQSPYKTETLRDLELYLKPSDDENPYVLVLDNDLPIYHTSPEDVVLRKSPTIKEMVSIKNAIKILNDARVVVSKKDASLETVRKDCLDQLDLSFDRNDIEAIEKDGIASLEREYLDGIKETMMLYAEVLGLKPVQKRFQMAHHEIYSKETVLGDDRYALAPVLMYSIVHDKLRLYEDKIAGTRKEIADFLKGLSSGTAKAHQEDDAVFSSLTNMAMGLPEDAGSRFHPKS